MIKVLARETREVEIDSSEVFKALNVLLGLDVLNKDFIWKKENGNLVAYEMKPYHGDYVTLKTGYMLVDEKVEIYNLLEKLKSYCKGENT